LPAPVRTQLRSRERLLADGRIAANALTVGQLYALGELEFAAPGPGVRAATDTTRQERGFAELFKASLDIIPAGSSWMQFARDAGTSVVEQPLDFFAATATGIRDYIENELKGYADIATGVGSWLADAGACVLRQIPLPFLEPDAIGGSESCNGLKQVAKSVQTVLDAIEKVRRIGFARLIEMGKALLDLVGRMFNELLHTGLELLKEWKTDVEEWLRSIAKDVKKLGSMLGTLLGCVLMEWLTAGVGRALKSARLAKNLPSRIPLPDVESIGVAGAAQPSLFPELGARAAGPEQAILDRLSNIFQRILAKHELELNRYLSLMKDRALRVDMPLVPDPPTYKIKRREPTWREYNEQRPVVLRFVRNEVRAASGRIGAHGGNQRFARRINRNSVTVHQADALSARRPEDFDVLELEGQKNGLLEDFFESNHIWEQRLLRDPRVFRAYADKWMDLKWVKVDDVTHELVPDFDAMTSILMPAAQHTSSLKRMLWRFGFPDAEADKIAKHFPESITTTLQRYIHIDGQGLPPDRPPKWPVLNIDPARPPDFKELLEKLETIYRQQAPGMWRNPDQPMDLFRQFNEWRRILGYTPIAD
jgi:hypothetical protein